MTVYVDDFRCRARVGGTSGRWSHLTADTPAELHEFAASIGLSPAWFQARCKHGPCPTVDDICRHYHFDVTDGKRQMAINRGAKAIKVAEFGEIVWARRVQYRAVAS